MRLKSQPDGVVVFVRVGLGGVGTERPAQKAGPKRKKKTFHFACVTFSLCRLCPST
jgi:hypothetical protein